MNGWERERFFRHRANFGKKNGALYSMFRFAVETQCKKCRIGKACMENASYSVPVYNRVAFCI